MHLRKYLSRPDSLKVSELRQRMQELGSDIKVDAQLRQWIALDDSGRFKRFPSAANAQFLEQASGGKITRKDMRPHDYGAIWPELKEPQKAKQKTATAHDD
jgi:DNA-binding transcriptional regulator YdaS (Cro superfamily)